MEILERFQKAVKERARFDKKKDAAKGQSFRRNKGFLIVKSMLIESVS